MTKEQTMTPLRTRMIEDMKLAGLAAKTQEVYLQAVSALAKHYKKSPELLNRGGGPRIFAGCSRAGRPGRGSCHYGIQSFCRNTLGKDCGLSKKRFDFRSKSVCRRLFSVARIRPSDRATAPNEVTSRLAGSSATF